MWSSVDFLCVLLFSLEVKRASAEVNEFLSGSGDFVGQTSSEVPSQHPKPQTELHTRQEFEWMRECLSQREHFVLRVTLWYVCVCVRIFVFCVGLCVWAQRLNQAIVPGSTIEVFYCWYHQNSRNILLLFKTSFFFVSSADMRNKILTIYLIRGVSFHSRIVSLKCSGSSVRRAAANR